MRNAGLSVADVRSETIEKRKKNPRSKTDFLLCSTVVKKQNNVTNDIFSHQTELGP